MLPYYSLASDRAGNFEPPHAVDGAPAPVEATGSLAFVTGDETLDVTLVSDDDRPIAATTDAPGVIAEVLSEGGRRFVRLRAAAQRLEADRITAIVRLRYADGDGLASMLAIGVSRDGART